MLGVQSFKLWHTLTTYVWYPYAFNNLFWSLWSCWYEFCCKMLSVFHLSKINDGLVRHVEILFQTCVWNCIEWFWIRTQQNCWCIWLLNGFHCTDCARHSSATSESVKPSVHACALVYQVRKTNFHELQNISRVPGLYGSKLVTYYTLKTRELVFDDPILCFY